MPHFSDVSFEEVSSSSSGGVPAAQGAASQGGGVAAVQGAANQLVHAPADSECDELWRTWPAMQESAIANGTVVVFDLVSRVGNAFMDLRNIIQVWVEQERFGGQYPSRFVIPMTFVCTHCRAKARHDLLGPPIDALQELHIVVHESRFLCIVCPSHKNTPSFELLLRVSSRNALRLVPPVP